MVYRLVTIGSFENVRFLAHPFHKHLHLYLKITLCIILKPLSLLITSHQPLICIFSSYKAPPHMLHMNSIWMCHAGDILPLVNDDIFLYTAIKLNVRIVRNSELFCTQPPRCVVLVAVHKISWAKICLEFHRIFTSHLLFIYFYELVRFRVSIKGSIVLF